MWTTVLGSVHQHNSMDQLRSTNFRRLSTLSHHCLKLHVIAVLFFCDHYTPSHGINMALAMASALLLLKTGSNSCVYYSTSETAHCASI